MISVMEMFHNDFSHLISRVNMLLHDYLQHQVPQCVASVMYAGFYYEEMICIQLPFRVRNTNSSDKFTEALGVWGGNFLLLSLCGSRLNYTLINI